MNLREIQKELEDELAEFPSRTEDLRRMTRYERYPRMFYRTNLWIHGRRIAASLRASHELIRSVAPDFDMRRGIALALVHDDAELVMGDFQSSNRALMDSEALAALDTKEERAIEVIASRYPHTVGGYAYEALLTDVLHVTTLEAQFVKNLDKIEGFMEAVHEMYAGNATFLERPPTEYGVPPNPSEYYPMYFAKMYEKVPLLQPFAGQEPFFGTTYTQDWDRVVQEGSLHTLESLRAPTGFALYDEWRVAQCASADSAILASLTTVIEP